MTREQLTAATRTPAAVVAHQAAEPRLPRGDGERFVAHGVMGMAFSTGHYLALRDMSATSIGPPYRSIWHRDPQGVWSIHTTIAPELSCPRYFSSALGCVEQVDAIQVTWTEDFAFDVVMGQRLAWHVHLGQTWATRLMSLMGRWMPAKAWRSDHLLGAMGPMAGPMLGAGRIRLRGWTPNQQRFHAGPVHVWAVTGSSARLDGVDLGEPGPLHRQSRLGDFWLPQRGIFFVGTAEFYPQRAPSSRPALKVAPDRSRGPIHAA